MAEELTKEQKLEIELAHVKGQAHSLASAMLLLMDKFGVDKFEVTDRELTESTVFEKGLVFFNDVDNNKYVIEVKEVDEETINLLGE